MLTLSGAPDVLSAGLTSHFSIKSQETLQDLSYNFQRFTGFVILTTC